MIRFFPLYQPTNRADRAYERQLQIGSISKHALDPVVNVKAGMAFRAMGLTRFRLYVLVATERA